MVVSSFSYLCPSQTRFWQHGNRRKPNAAAQARQIAGARHERTLFAVACSRLILIEVPSSAYPGGMLIVGN